jgi:exodeoxyribonuclease VII large subunit
LEDLWAFNDERVVRAVAACPLPVICGVGHETDITLCDLAADRRAATPTAAAELASPERDELLGDLASLRRRLQAAVNQRLDRQAQGLDVLAHRAGKPAAWLHVQGLALMSLSARLQRALGNVGSRQALKLASVPERLQRAGRLVLERRSQRLDTLQARMQAAHPKQVLSRGFAWLAQDDGQAVITVKGLSPGQSLRAVLADGELQTTVQQVLPKAP